MVTISPTFKNLSDVPNLTNTFGTFGNEFEYTVSGIFRRVTDLGLKSGASRGCSLIQYPILLLDFYIIMQAQGVYSPLVISFSPQ